MSEVGQGAASLANRALRGSFYSVGASLVTLVLGFGRAVLLARLLLPQDYGVVTLAVFYIGLVAQLRGLGLDAAIIHRQEPSAALIKTYMAFRSGLDVLAFGLLALASPLLQRAYPQMAGLGQVLPVLTLAYLVANVSQIQETLLRKELAFSRLAATDVISSVTMTVVAPYLAWRGWGVWALVAERVVGMGMRFLLTWGPFRQQRLRLGWDRQEAGWLWAFGKPTWAAINLSYLVDQFDEFWTGTALGQVALGLYAKAYEFAHYPRRVLANPLVAVLGPVFARVQDDRLRLSRLFYRSASLIVRTSFLITGAFALIMPEFIRWVIGDKWLPMLWTFRLMMVYTALDALLMLVENLLLAVGKPQALRNARLAQALFFIPAVIVGARLGGINGVALAADLMLLVGAWRLYHPLREAVDFSWARLLLWPLVALGAAWGLGFWLEMKMSGLAWQILCFKAGAFGLVFVLLLLVAERGEQLRMARWLWEAARSR